MSHARDRGRGRAPLAALAGAMLLALAAASASAHPVGRPSAVSRIYPFMPVGPRPAPHRVLPFGPHGVAVVGGHGVPVVVHGAACFTCGPCGLRFAEEHAFHAHLHHGHHLRWSRIPEVVIATPSGWIFVD
jgi:hypothetical protein